MLVVVGWCQWWWHWWWGCFCFCFWLCFRMKCLRQLILVVPLLLLLRVGALAVGVVLLVVIASGDLPSGSSDPS